MQPWPNLCCGLRLPARGSLPLHYGSVGDAGGPIPRSWVSPPVLWDPPVVAHGLPPSLLPRGGAMTTSRLPTPPLWDVQPSWHRQTQSGGGRRKTVTVVWRPPLALGTSRMVNATAEEGISKVIDRAGEAPYRGTPASRHGLTCLRCLSCRHTHSTLFRA